MTDTYTIGDLAQATGTKVVTIRYYESMSLLPTPPRSRGNYRIYNRGHLDRLGFIRRARLLGFTLEQIGELLKLSEDKKHACGEVDEVARAHLADVDAKLKDLKRLAKQLRQLIGRCQRGGTIKDCRILEALSH